MFLLIAIWIFFCQWWQIIKRNTILFTKKTRCGRVMMNEWLITGGVIAILPWNYCSCFKMARMIIPLNMKIFKILKTIFFTYFEYAENDGGIYFAHKYIYLLEKNISFRQVFFIYISNDLINAFGTDVWGGLWTTFFKLITTTLVSCVSDMLRSWWFQDIAKKDRQINWNKKQF